MRLPPFLLLLLLPSPSSTPRTHSRRAGEPADNAAHFFEWLQSPQGSELAGVRFAVFGCGNRDWVRTFQRVPRVVDELLAARGGARLLARGVGDTQAADFFEAFDEWEARLWEELAKVRCFLRFALWVGALGC